MRKNLWLFLLKLLVFSLALGYLWFTRYQRLYPYWIDGVADPFFEFVGVRKWWLGLVVEHFTNLVPYLALVLASPGFFRHWRRTLAALVGGVAILVLGHLLLSWAVYHFNELYSLSRSFYRIVIPMYIINDALPLLLWLSFFPSLLTELFGFKWLGKTTEK
ncbi:MAG: hypothetical protein ABII79_14290 [bacterium]